MIGVPIALKALDGMDSLLSIVQMPRGIPVAAVAIDNARNAGLLAVRILAVRDQGLRAKVVAFQERLAAEVVERDAALQEPPRQTDRPGLDAVARRTARAWHRDARARHRLL